MLNARVLCQLSSTAVETVESDEAEEEPSAVATPSRNKVGLKSFYRKVRKLIDATEEKKEAQESRCS